MKKIVEYVICYKKFIFFLLLGISCVFGLYIGYMSVDRYQTIVSGVLGLSTLYLLHLEFLSPKRNANNRGAGINIELPKDLIYLIYGFFLAIILFWAMIQIVNAFWYILRLFKA